MKFEILKESEVNKEELVFLTMRKDPICNEFKVLIVNEKGRAKKNGCILALRPVRGKLELIKYRNFNKKYIRTNSVKEIKEI